LPGPREAFEEASRRGLGVDDMPAGAPDDDFGDLT
jgi:hypothetical protein